MRVLRTLLLPSLLLLGLAACGGGGSDAASDNGGAAATQTDLDVYVDGNGSDATGDGTSAKPFRTITRGITALPFGATLRVGAGEYDAASGEHFPIVPGIGATIVGTERHGAFGTMWLSHVEGGETWSGDPDGRLHAAIVPTSDNRIVSLAIRNPQPFVVGGAKPAPIVLAASRVTIESCLLHGSDKGVRYVRGVRGSWVHDCRFSRNGIGIFVDGAGLDNRVEDCTVTENNVGVMCFTGGVDFGGGPFGSVGRNAFAGSVAQDFVHFTGSFADTIFAAGCLWDNDPPARTTSGVGAADIWEATGPVLTTPSTLYVPSLPFDWSDVPVATMQ